MKVGTTKVRRLALKVFAVAQGFLFIVPNTFWNIILWLKTGCSRRHCKGSFAGIVWICLPSLLFNVRILQAVSADTIPVVFANVPVQLVGKTIFVEATVNGKKGNFIFDTGSPGVILNSEYFPFSGSTLTNSEMVDLHGHVCQAQNIWIEEIAIAGFPLAGQVATTMDLSALEAVKDIQVAGIIGYSAFQDLELLFDFEEMQLWLFSLGNGDWKSFPVPAGPPSDSMEFRMSGHIPYVNARLGGKTLRLGIDTGSEVNILKTEMLKGNTAVFKPTGRLYLKGIASGRKKLPKGFIEDIVIEEKEIEPIEMVLTDLRRLNENLLLPLHGLLGCPFLLQGKTAISYKRKKIYRWQTEQILAGMSHQE